MYLITATQLAENNGSQQQEYLALINEWNLKDMVYERFQFIMAVVEFLSGDADDEFKQRAAELLLSVSPLALRAFAVLEIKQRNPSWWSRHSQLMLVDADTTAERAHGLYCEIVGEDRLTKERVFQIGEALTELKPIDLVMLLADAAAGHLDQLGTPVAATLVEVLSQDDVAQQMAAVMDAYQQREKKAANEQGEQTNEQTADDTKPHGEEES